MAIKYHCLVHVKTGEVSHFQRPPSVWGKKERPPVFHIIEVEVEDEKFYLKGKKGVEDEIQNNQK